MYFQGTILTERVNEISHSYFLSFPVENLSTDSSRCPTFFKRYHLLSQIVQSCLTPQTSTVPIPVVIIRSRTEQTQSDGGSQQFLPIQSQRRKCSGVLIYNESCFSCLLRAVSRGIFITGKYKLVVRHFPVGIHQQSSLFAAPAKVQISFPYRSRKFDSAQQNLCCSMRLTVHFLRTFGK